MLGSAGRYLAEVGINKNDRLLSLEEKEKKIKKRTKHQNYEGTLNQEEEKKKKKKIKKKSVIILHSVPVRGRMEPDCHRQTTAPGR